MHQSIFRSNYLEVLNYEKQHKEGTCKVLGRSVVYSAFYAEFCLCPKSVIITTLKFTTAILCPVSGKEQQMFATRLDRIILTQVIKRDYK